MRFPIRGYRPDIDGLRAVAIACVVAYHSFPKTAHGGFIGVDVFFVISGFLITSLIAEDIASNRFSFRDFYARRIRRIFPALAIVLIGVLALGALVLDPSEFRALGLQIAAGAGFLSNVLLWSQAGYFDQTAEFKPLLHLWSLAVEEQFYIIWPLALYLCARLRGSLWALATAFAAVSFALNLYMSAVDPVGDFYFVFSRIWELLIGAALALTAFDARRLSPRLANAAAALGLALIFASVLIFRAGQPFPGWRALAPTVGTALIIAAGPGAFVNARWLSARASVAIGKISYPIYLWHWPLLALIRICEGGEPRPPVRWALIVVSVALSQFTYVFIERPIRFGAYRRRQTVLAVVLVAALGTVGLWDFRVGGLLFPNSTWVRVANEGDIGSDEFGQYLAAHSSPCDLKLFPPMAEQSKGALRCGQTIAGASPEVVLVGDSHAEHFFLGVAAALPKTNVGWYFGDSIPYFDDPRFASVYAALAADPKVKTVILSAAWKGRLRRSSSSLGLRAEISRVLAALLASGKKVYVANDVPSFSFHPGRCKYDGRLGFPAKCDENISVLNRQLAFYSADLEAAVASNPGARLIDTAHMLCKADACSMVENGKLLYRDGGHLNINGSYLIGARIVADISSFADEAPPPKP